MTRPRLLRVLNRSLAVKVVAPIALVGVGASFLAIDRVQHLETSEDEARARGVGLTFAQGVELGADLAGEAGLLRAVTDLAAPDGLERLIVVAGDPPQVVASDQIELVGDPAGSLDGHALADIDESRPALSAAAPSVVRSGDHTDIVVRLDLAGLAARDQRYADAFMYLELSSTYVAPGGIGGRGPADQLAFMLGLVAVLCGVALLVFRIVVLQPVGAIRRAVRARRDGRTSAMPRLPADGLGELAHSLDEAFAGLEASEQRYRALAANAWDVVLLVDAEARLAYASPSGERVLGYSPGDVVGAPALEFLHPDDLEDAAASLGRTFAEDGVRGTAHTYRVKRADGTYGFFDIVGTNRLGDPSLRAVVLNLHEVTREREAEEALRASERRFRALVERSTDLTVVLSREGKITYASPSVTRLLGRTVEEVVGADAFSFVHPDDLVRAADRLALVAENPDLPREPFEMRLVAADGSEVHVEARANDRFDEPDIDGLILNMRDVTDRRRSDDALRESEARTRSILAGAADGIITIDEHGHIESFNSAAERIFGWGAADVIGRNVSILMPEPNRSQHDGYLARARDRGFARDPDEVVSLDAVRRNGEVFPVELALAAVEVAGRRTYTGILRDVTEKREFERQLAFQAMHDGLTGLPNRRALLDRIETAMTRARRSGDLVALLFLDLDRFKVVNDSLGHERGDLLLCLAAERMRHAVRETDTLARLGGDEFVVLCEDVETIRGVTDLAERIGVALSEPFDLEGTEAFVTASTGIAVWDGGDESPDDLLRNADTAMYRAKDGGRDRYELFDAAMQAWALARLEFETSLRHAVGRDELRLHFQPVVRLATGRVEKFEALVRWERPGHGLVPPVDFIGAAEETGLIVPLGAWVLEESCRQAAAWQRDFPGRNLEVSVNLSSRQLVGGEITDTVSRALDRSGLEPSLLTLEITESLLLADAPQALDMLAALKDLGVGLALDDFGTGYSSLTYLRRFPIDMIKIDRSFVRLLGGDGEDTTIVAAIVQLSRALGLEVVAEGIDDPAQLAALLELGCHFGQGFWFSRPVPPEVLPSLLRSGVVLAGGS